MAEQRARAGFTLLELLVVMALIGLAMSAVFTRGGALLPQRRLRSSAEDLGTAMEQARCWAVLRNKPLAFSYDLDSRGYEAYHPYATNDLGQDVGPGRTPLIPWTELQPGIAIAEVRLPGGLVRDAGVVTLEVSALGRVPSHEVLVVNPEHEETEAMTLRVNGLANRSEVFEGNVTMEPLADVDFR